MNYFETFSELKEILEKAKIKKTDGHLAIQVCITDTDASGIFYIEDFGDRILAEPYDYYDNDAEIIGQASDLKMLFEKKLDLEDAIKSGVIIANGNTDALKSFLERIAKTPVKKATKSSPKTTTKKATAKKTEVKKVTEDTKNKNVKPKDSETVKEVVEKEIKSKKK
ncbi:MAG: SCP2 sterol-binding domain-containing protein [Clostridia bacterium]|nr:SCP2 sterol-binding domain-containing protein [Clostridia bacterium]